MTRVLLIEPDKMLRHALAVALFPEFEIHIMDRVPQAAPNDSDVTIIDAAALQGQDNKSIGARLDGHLPIVWIDNKGTEREASMPRCVRLTWPVTKEALRNAVAECLGSGSKKDIESSASAKAKKAAVPTARKAKKEAAAEADRIIELVDVVEEPNPN